jgi:hypothetical protein
MEAPVAADAAAIIARVVFDIVMVKVGAGGRTAREALVHNDGDQGVSKTSAFYRDGDEGWLGGHDNSTEYSVLLYNWHA